MSITILLILVLASKTISASNPECENITYCECSENQLGDISSILISNNNLTFTIGVASWSDFQVDCNNLGWYEFNIIRKEFADVVDLVKKELKREHLEGFPNLTKLVLSNNGLTNISSDFLSNFAELEFLDLSENNLVLSKDNFKETLNLKQLDNLETIDLSNNNFKEHLEEVELRRNYLNNIPENLFWYSTSLKYIDLSENNFRILPESIFRNLQNIEKILISKNLIEILPDIIFTSVRKLKVLDLSFNRISIVQRNLFNGLTSLEELNMEGNRLKYIHSKAFSTNEQLSIAKFSDNILEFDTPLNMMSPFFNNHLLKELHLSNNKIKYFYSDWTTNKLELELLDLRHNDISE
ncbi:PREDICTED: leucine-rich repeat-containing protein 15-like [Polistes dominula]|uniref:Leucine-rich repeat-containing protein 15-like n=1 Tax=Polistes dominula TaxID=743375 RepID=A0ABM1JB17_POLDO|nr:PREDICTED: leucine-rich repeat-containing protein 15-like [Polistes dominula]